MADYGSSGIWVDYPAGPFRHSMVSHDDLHIHDDLARRFSRWIQNYWEHKKENFELLNFNDEGWRLAQLLQMHFGAGTQVLHAAERRGGGICADREVVGEKDLPEGWSLVGHSADTLAFELAREIGSAHPLQGIRPWAFARRFDSDDILFAIEHATHPWAVVHLTWSKSQERPPWPRTELYTDWTAFKSQPAP